MRITFLGTSHGVPEPNRRCSSTLIEVGGRYYIIDMGTQAIELLIGKNIAPEAIEAIFITHMHGDHSNGLISFLDLCSWKFKTASPVLYIPKDPEGVREAMRAWISCNGVAMRDFDFREVKAGLIFDDGNIRIFAYRTKHTDYSYAYLMEAEGKRVFFSGDFCVDGPVHDFPTEVLDEPLDLAICESAHFDATDYLPIFEGNENLKQLYFTHYYDRRLASVVEMTARLPDIPVRRALDGMEIVL